MNVLWAIHLLEFSQLSLNIAVGSLEIIVLLGPLQILALIERVYEYRLGSDLSILWHGDQSNVYVQSRFDHFGTE